MLKHGPSESLPLKGRSCWAHSSEWEHNTMTHTQIFGSHESNTLDQLRDVASRAERAALMADGHLGYVMPIGGVAAYRDKVSVVGVGFDIACGNAAIRTDLQLPQIQARLRELADEIQASLSFGVGLRNRADDAPTDDPLFEDPAWDAVPDRHERDRLRAKAREQLGTVGSGNHYVDLFADEEDHVWVGVHFGSRGFGYGVAHGFLALSQNKQWGERAPEREVLLDVHAPIGDAYWQVMNLAGRYAYAGRERKSTRLNSSHGYISYAVFCLKKKKNNMKKVLR